MYKIVILLAVACCVTAQNNTSPCVDETTATFSKTEAKRFKEEAENLADVFYNVEGTPESKFDLYKTTCEEIKDKVLHNIKSLDILQCKTENVDISGYDRKWFAKRYFELMCNLKVNEYLGYVQVVLGKTLEEGIDCVKLIEQPSAKVDEDSFNNFCSNKMPSMLNCLEKISVGKENQLSFHKAQLSNWLGVTCDGEFDEEKYLKHMKRINSYGNYKMILNRMFEAPFKYD